MLTWLRHVLGLDDGSGGWYLFWSGFGANLGEITLIGGIIAVFRRHNCHVKGCPRIGKHAVDGTPYMVCSKHHPAINGKPSAQDVIDADHAASQARR